MFQAPSGFEDLLADAEDTPVSGEFREVDVPDVGVVAIRRPAPRAAAALAMAVNPKLKPDAQAGYLNRFVIDHIGEERFTELLFDMVTGDMPSDTVGRVGRAVATCGTARPYLAVSTLSAMAAQNWRAIRSHLAENGIPDPLTGLPSLHALLDITENMVLESYGQEKPDAAKAKRARFLDALYAPERTPTPINGDDYQERPPGFEDESVEAAFDAFERAAR